MLSFTRKEKAMEPLMFYIGIGITMMFICGIGYAAWLLFRILRIGIRLLKLKRAERRVKMREAQLEQKMKTEVEARGGMFLKWVSPGFTGVPDRIALLPGGRIVFVEVKRPGEKDGRSPRQRRVAFQLKGLGFDVIRAASLEELRDAI